MKSSLVLVIFHIYFCCGSILDSGLPELQRQDILHRTSRAAVAKKGDCRYDKGVWEECDANGTQKRVLKLQVASGRNQGQTGCEDEKVQTRPCKKSCRYSKGLWTDCRNGMRSRTDVLKGPTSGCENERIISRKCKVVCRYNKADWSNCENGVKTKTLSLVEGNASDCESSKKITKQCVVGNATSGSPMRNTNRGKGGRKLTTPIP